MGELWGANCEDLEENWPRHDGTALYVHIDGLVQGRRNVIANALETRPSCTNPSVYTCMKTAFVHVFTCIYIQTRLSAKNNNSLHSFGAEKEFVSV